MKEIEIQNISKNFKSVKALDHVSLHIKEHTIYGLLGRNGAGKTTLLNIINNRLPADEGTVKMDGVAMTENDNALKQCFFVSEKMLYPEGMKVKEVFKWTEQFFHTFDMTYAKKLSEMFGLDTNIKTKNLSTGYQSIFKNIVALSTNVPYIFLDEPVLGLDAYHRDLFYKVLIEKYSKNPFTIVISTHLIEEVANVIEEVIIIKNGRIIKNESIESILKQGYTISGATGTVDSYTANKEVIGADTLGGLKTAYIMGIPDENIPVGLEISRMDLQKLFIQLTNI